MHQYYRYFKGLSLTFNTYGFYPHPAFAKTVLPSFSDQEIVDCIRCSTTVITSKAKVTKMLHQASNGKYFEGYINKDNPLIYDTMYPVLTISSDDIDESGNIKIGGFGRIRSDKSGVDIVYSKNLSKARLEECITEGKPFGLGVSKSESKSGYDVIDITEPLSRHCAEELSKMRATKMPGTVYAITRITSGAADGATDDATDV